MKMMMMTMKTMETKNKKQNKKNWVSEQSERAKKEKRLLVVRRCKKNVFFFVEKRRPKRSIVSRLPLCAYMLILFASISHGEGDWKMGGVNDDHFSRMLISNVKTKKKTRTNSNDAIAMKPSLRKIDPLFWGKN